MNKTVDETYPTNGATTCKANYEAMYDDLFCQYRDVCAKCEKLESDLRMLEMKSGKLEAQLEIVRLIFGGVNRG